MRFLEFRHVDGDQVVLAAIEKIGEGERGFGLPDAAGTDQHENADGLVGIVEAGARCGNSLADNFESVRLSDHALAEKRQAE